MGERMDCAKATLVDRLNTSECENRKLLDLLGIFNRLWERRDKLTPNEWNEQLEDFAKRHAKHYVPMSCPADAPYEADDVDEEEQEEIEAPWATRDEDLTVPRKKSRGQQKKRPVLTLRKPIDEPLCCFAFCSDTHSGCQLALCPPGGVPLDNGGNYHCSPLQEKLWVWWGEFWEFVDRVVGARRLGIVHLGDAIEGTHHRATTPITHNEKDHIHIAKMVLGPLRERAAKMWLVKGTDAHVGESGKYEQILGELLKTEPMKFTRGGEDGAHIETNYARPELNLRFGPERMWRMNMMHHVSPTSNPQFTANALCKELYFQTSEALKWNRLPPHLLGRAHRHTFTHAEQPSAFGIQKAFALPCWQLKGPFVYKTPYRVWQPQCGGAVVECDEHEIRVHHFVRSVEQAIWEDA